MFTNKFDVNMQSHNEFLIVAKCKSYNVHVLLYEHVNTSQLKYSRIKITIKVFETIQKSSSEIRKYSIKYIQIMYPRNLY